MKYHAIEVGIEHLMSGIVFRGTETDGPIQFVRQSASVMLAIMTNPFVADWPNRATIDSHEIDFSFEQTSDGEIRYYAQVVGAAMRDCEERSYAMQKYSRAPFDFDGSGPNLLAPGEPERFPEAVVKAMRRKFGEYADDWLSKLRWSHGHWHFNYAGMYHGVEPDGHIHT